ncbi:unnamed protein product [Closterium sp. NIES-64]|nr:unnamed protein product [Closterium sp. NIES-64]
MAARIAARLLRGSASRKGPDVAFAAAASGNAAEGVSAGSEGAVGSASAASESGNPASGADVAAGEVIGAGEEAGEAEWGTYRDRRVAVRSFSGEARGEAVLDGTIFDVPVRRDIVHRVVLWQLAKRRQVRRRGVRGIGWEEEEYSFWGGGRRREGTRVGAERMEWVVNCIGTHSTKRACEGTHSTKRACEVRGSSSKPWKQKGTGRARHGSRRGPQARVPSSLACPAASTFRPVQPLTHALSLPRQWHATMHSALLLTTLSQYQPSHSLHLVSLPPIPAPLPTSFGAEPPCTAPSHLLSIPTLTFVAPHFPVCHKPLSPTSSGAESPCTAPSHLSLPCQCTHSLNHPPSPTTYPPHQFRGGAAMHGPKPRSHAFSLNKKVRALGLKAALSARLREGQVRVQCAVLIPCALSTPCVPAFSLNKKLVLYSDLDPGSPKTKEMAQHIATAFPESKKILFVDGSQRADETLLRASGNLHYVNVLPVVGLNVYSIVQHDALVLSLPALQALEHRLLSAKRQVRPGLEEKLCAAAAATA